MNKNKLQSLLVLLLLLCLTSCDWIISRTWKEFSDIEYEKGNYGKAIVYLNYAIERNPDQAGLYLKKAYCYEHLENYELALVAVDSCIMLDGTIYMAYSTKAILLGYLNRLDSSLVYHAKAINLRPRSHAYYNRGCTFREFQQFDKAIADFDTAISLDSNNCDAYYERAHIRAVEYKDFINAIPDFTQMISKFKPQNRNDSLFLSAGFLLRGTCYDLTGDWVFACNDFKNSKKLGSTEANKYLKNCR